MTPPAGHTGAPSGTATSRAEQELRLPGAGFCPGSFLPSPTLSPRRGGTSRSQGQARCSEPFGLQQGDASFPAKLEGGGSEHALPAPQRQGHRSQQRGRRSPGSPMPLGVRRPRAAPPGFRSPTRRRARPQRICAALRVPASSLRSLLQTGAPRLGTPVFTPSPGPGGGSLWSLPAAHQAGKLDSRGAG